MSKIIGIDLEPPTPVVAVKWRLQPVVIRTRRAADHASVVGFAQGGERL